MAWGKFLCTYAAKRHSDPQKTACPHDQQPKLLGNTLMTPMARDNASDDPMTIYLNIIQDESFGGARGTRSLVHRPHVTCPHPQREKGPRIAVKFGHSGFAVKSCQPNEHPALISPEVPPDPAHLHMYRLLPLRWFAVVWSACVIHG